MKACVDNSISLEDRATILSGTITCLSACFYNVSGVYDERIVFPNLYLFIMADVGMGKGALTLCRELVSPINCDLHELTKRMDKDYQNAMQAYSNARTRKTALS